MITENLSTLKIHRLTQEQYDRALANGNIDESALYLTPDEDIDLSGYATTEQLNEKADTTHTHEIGDITNLQSSLDETLEEFKSYTDTKMSGLISNTVADNKISTHNTSTEAHSDIRSLIDELTEKLNNFLDVDDTTTDQLSEVLTLIENNKGTLESLTTNKINVSDIVDNLTTASADKVLSANQGVAIKTLIDELEAVVDGKANTSHTHTISNITNLQSTLDGKQKTITGAATSIIYSDLSPSIVPITSSTGKILSSSVTTTELGRLSGVTGNVQTQINDLKTSKANAAHTHTTTDITDLQSKLDEANSYTDQILATHISDVDENVTHITETERVNWNSAYDHSLEDHYAFSNITVGGTTIVADSKKDTLTLEGSNVTITPDTTNDKVTISVADGTTSTKGIVKLTNSTSSTSTTTAATPNSVKSAYDLANTAKDAATNAQSTADTKADAGHKHTVSDVTDLTVTATELNYVGGVTSNIQTQLDGKMVQTNPTGTGSISINRDSGSTIGQNSAAFGNLAVASGDYSFAEGFEPNALGVASHSEGFFTNASGKGSHAEGDSTAASGNNAHAEGYNTKAYGKSSHAEGYQTCAYGSFSHAEGKSGNRADLIVDQLHVANKDDIIAAWNEIEYETEFALASGSASHVEGSNCLALGDYSHAEGDGTQALDTDAHAEGCYTIASGSFSHAEGYYTTASGYQSHAEGNKTVASGDDSHAEGQETVASGNYSHAEGYYSVASNNGAHAEGYDTKASGLNSHAEGSMSEAEGDYSHAEGYYTIAKEDGAHAEGYRTIALGHQHAQGHFNNTTNATAGVASGTSSDTKCTAFVIGNGTESSASNAFRVTYGGKPYAKSTLTSTGADYAEFFEWKDLNPNSEDRRGYFVTLDEDKIKIAEPNDYILGVISGQPSVVGNGDEDWLGRYVFDDFGAFVYEDFEYEVEIPEEVQEEVTNEETGETTVVTKTVTKTVKKTGIKYKENPDYDPTIPYIHREDRPEWDYVGMLGVLSVRDDGTCQVNGYCKVAEGGIATASETGYRVIKRISDNVVKVIFR